MSVIEVSTPGPQGPAGPAGANGTNGANGATGPQGPQGIPGAYARWDGHSTYIGLVAGRTSCASDKITTALEFNSRSAHVAVVDISSIGAAVAGWYIGYGDSTPFGEKAIGADSQRKVSIEYNGQIAHLTFGGPQQTTGTCYNFSTLYSDLTTLPFTIPKGATFFVREHGVVGVGGTIPVANTGNPARNTAAGDCFEYGTGLPDRSGDTGTFASTDTPYLRPVALFGPTNVHSYSCSGDSRVVGLQDDGANNLHVGEQARAIGSSAGYTNLAIVGEAMSSVGSTTLNGVFNTLYTQRGDIIRRFCTRVICNYGINDVVNNQSAQQMSVSAQALRAMFPQQQFYWTTQMAEGPNPPYTTIGAAFNNFIMASVGGFLDGAFDVATALSTARNSCTYGSSSWVSNDGVHESPAGYAIAAGAIQLPA
ncbi:collagen-like triple helix repeat-containing protein [Paraburkholderia franconis]|uniref:collagen-like triple helix repeat-containing protein n=1 Tax=Paraburkholderia franconis TaxID=2654983 RepID=UPI001D100D82|nr:collagen-like protein [Paraburkholderia franconis]